MRKRFGVYIFIISIVLLGLLWVQFFWIKYSIDLKNTQFDASMNRTLKEVKDDLEERYYCFKLYADLRLDKHEGFYMLMHQGDSLGNYLPVTAANSASVIDTLETYARPLNYDTIVRFNRFIFPAPVNAQIEFNFEYDYRRTLDITDSVGGIKDWIINSYRNTIIDPVSRFRIVDTVDLNRLMSEKMKDLDIDNFQYAVTDHNSDSVIYSIPPDASEALFESHLKTTLYQDANFFNPYDLYIYVPDRNLILLKNLWLVLVCSGGIIIVLIWLFAFFVNTLIHQRRLNEMKSDFINNMTHEFNTPVSNINLALDTINGHTDVQANSHLLGIIREENKRIQENISLILQTASIERGELTMHKEKTDVKEVVTKVVNSFQLKVEENKGHLMAALPKDQVLVEVDEVHFVNLLHNLLDNAIKYSGEKIEIDLQMKKNPEGMYISVRDHGIGIREEDQDKIFDKFFRVPTGKIHDVKGFGLGLHYARQVIRAHQGSIQVKSKFGKGSEFIVFVPN